MNHSSMCTTHPFIQTNVAANSYMKTRIGENWSNAPEKATNFCHFLNGFTEDLNFDFRHTSFAIY